MKGIADTSFIVAFRNRTDRHHAWAVKLAGGIAEPLLTSESVLSEAAFHLRSSGAVLALVDDGLLRVAFGCSRELEKLCELARRYENRHPDLAHLRLIRLSELYPRHPVITVDEADLGAYPRNKREVIPVIYLPS
jgi:predicted nucleic acid-binding protein